MTRLLVNHGISIDYTEEGWDEFVKWIDGTYASLNYIWSDEKSHYIIIAIDTDVCRIFNVNKDDATIFESTYKLSIPVSGTQNSAKSIPVVMANDQNPLQVTITQGLATHTISELLTLNGSTDMVVNGNSPKEFSYDADPTDDIVLNSIRFVCSVQHFNFSGDSFGKGGGILSNGITVNIVANNGELSKTIFTLNVNEDWFRLLDVTSVVSSVNSVITGSLPFSNGVILKAGSSDKVSVTINDNLTRGSRGINHLSATLYGVKG